MADGLDAAIMGGMTKRKATKNPVLRVLTFQHPMERETSLFLLVSLLDFVMTWWMLNHRDPDSPLRFGESNAVARWFLHGWGYHGLLYFKVAICLFIVLSTQVIHLRRPNTAKAILWLGIAVTSLTVIYSVALYLRHTT
jgi:hypothetical protein